MAVVMAVMAAAAASPAEGARAFFVFGDSLVDNGNNNYLLTSARADMPPYGIDHPSHRPTGRFSNGLNIPDIISEHLGAEPTLPYLSPDLRGAKLLVGANFASAGVGILNDTGIQFQFALPDYVRFLISEYKKILQRLYDMGARRVLVTGTGPLGCAPAERALRGRGGGCAPQVMRAAELFNPQLSRALGEMNARVGRPGAFMAANSFRVHFDFISNPAAFGFATARDACCGQGPNNGLGLCTAMSNLCADRDAYVFWDAYHPTEKANRIIVSQFVRGSLDYVSPLNLSAALEIDAAEEAAAAAARRRRQRAVARLVGDKPHA
ncbi:hypothetical protein OsI_33925 [Oryza sativa Indica Group]|uniref:GDSL esterase/lipase n=1 Tax=Oryza sativa subsp. indica TaxID=39946 RepID=A2Z887_ORYSI|nr:hypothetical protein OsI_33925 [Oryza sativa Indica Group]